jgi:predicted phage terminase large subunit-like protein
MGMRWTREHEASRQRIIELLCREERPFADASPEASAARRALPFLDWCGTYLPHYCSHSFAPLHYRIARAGEPGMPTFIAAFRGAGKSVLRALAQPLKRILDRQTPYIIFGARVQILAAQLMDYVRIELTHNLRIRMDYGEVKVNGDENCWVAELGRKEASGPARAQHGRWALRETKVEAFGIGQSPRGRRFKQYRPLDFIGDDLEDAALARNPRREMQLWNWLWDEVLPAMEPDDYLFTVLGTIYGPGCMMERAREFSHRTDPKGLPLCVHVREPAVTGDVSAWPERFSYDALMRLRAQVGLGNWLRNYALVAEDPDKPFQALWFGVYDESDLAGRLGSLDVVAFLDPALSEAPTGCPRALVVVGAARDSGLRYVLDAWIERGTPKEMLDRVIETNKRWRPRVIGIESNGGYALLKPLLESRPNSEWIPVRFVAHTESKEIRIERLAPAFEAGRWLFPRNPPAGVRTLQEQLLSYPDGFADGPDALAGCDEMLPDAWRPAAAACEYKSLGRRRDYAEVV